MSILLWRVENPKQDRVRMRGDGSGGRGGGKPCMEILP